MQPDPTNPNDRDADPQVWDRQVWEYVFGELTDGERAAFEQRLFGRLASEHPTEAHHGELSDEISDDALEACEAIARAVELADVLRAACAAPISAQSLAGTDMVLEDFRRMKPVRPLRWRRWAPRAGWMALGAAACLALVFVGRAWLPVSEHIAGNLGPSGPSADEDRELLLALTWHDLADDSLADGSSEFLGNTTLDSATLDSATLDRTAWRDLGMSGDELFDGGVAWDGSPASAVAETDFAAPGWLLAAVAGERDDAPPPMHDEPLPN